MKIILASASPRRRELLEQIGAAFTVQPAVGEERITKIKPEEAVQELAEQKAGEIYDKSDRHAGEDMLVIGADTVVVYEGQIIGKPKDEADAARILSMLSGRTHAVYTGVSLQLYRQGEKLVRTFYEKTEVSMYAFTEEEITDYIRTMEPLDKAGAYGIQGIGAKLVRGITGDYNNVVGLPVSRIYRELRKLGIDISLHS